MAKSSPRLLQADAIVLGAGMAGLVAARLHLANGARSVLIIDEYEACGGNHINCDFGPYTFDIGAIIFQDDSPLMKHFPELLELYHPIEPSISRIAPDNVVRKYPIDARKEVFGLDPVGLARLFGSIAWNRMQGRKPSNVDEYARFWMGSYLFERSGLAGYIRRFCGVPAAELDIQFAEQRMGWIRDAGSVSHRLAELFRIKPPMPVNQSFVRPRNGFRDLYRLAQRTLETDGVAFELGQAATSIRKENGTFVVSSNDFIARSAALTSTIPVDRCYSLLGLDAVPRPPAGRLHSLFFSFAGDRGFSTSILYNFSKYGDWKRLTMFSDFYGRAEDREFFTAEVVTTSDASLSGAELGERFKDDAARQPVFKGDLRFEGSFELDYAYPLYVKGAAEQAAAMIAALRDAGIRAAGRQGRYDYLPTARQVTLAVEDAFKDTP